MFFELPPHGIADFGCYLLHPQSYSPYLPRRTAIIGAGN
jgi:hypothetical protein